MLFVVGWFVVGWLVVVGLLLVGWLFVVVGWLGSLAINTNKEKIFQFVALSESGATRRVTFAPGDI